MHQKKYGKMTPGAWVNMELEHSSPVLMVMVAIIMAAGGILVRFFTGSPHMTLLALEITDMVPPVWLLTLLWTLSFLTIGGAMGLVLGYRNPGCEAEKYKGCMLFVLMAVLELCWYPTLFGAGLVFLSVLETVLILCLSVSVTLCFYRVTRLSGMLLLLHDIWLVYMLILNFAVFFRV